jgi:uncharacterized protein involved in cysteine biosynthesis
MLQDLVLGLRELGDPAVRRVLIRCVLLALATFAALVGAVGALLAWLDLTGLAWLDATIAVAGSAATLVLAWLLFPVTVALTLGLFAEEVVEAVERRHYPELPPPRQIGLAESTLSAARFTAVAVLLNLLALPLYLMPGLNVPAFLALNGYLLGREYFELVAQRQLPGPAASALRRAARGQVWLAGAVIAGLLAIPVFNLVAPVVAIAFMVHRFQRLQRSAARRAVANRDLDIRPTGDRSV